MNINLTAPINSLGYGVAGTNILASLMENGNNVALWPINGRIEPDDYTIQTVRLNEALNNQSFFDNNAPSIKVWHQHDLAQHVGRGKRVGFPIFELNQFNKRELHHLSSQDHLFVCSDWAKRVVEQNLPENHMNISVVPLGVNRKIFNEDIKRQRKGNTRVFLNIGKWEIRKGHDILVEAFNNAFCPKDDVELWMVPTNPFLNEAEAKEWESLYKNSALGSKITIFPRLTSQQDVAQIMTEADIGVFPARAEGWNLELLEMMSCGKNVIATNYSAHTEFCNKENCSLISIDNLEIAYDGKFFHGQGGEWAALEQNQIDQLVASMRYWYKEQPNENLEGIETARKFTWNSSAFTIVSELQ